MHGTSSSKLVSVAVTPARQTASDTDERIRRLEETVQRIADAAAAQQQQRRQHTPRQKPPPPSQKAAPAAAGKKNKPPKASATKREPMQQPQPMPYQPMLYAPTDAGVPLYALAPYFIGYAPQPVGAPVAAAAASSTDVDPDAAAATPESEASAAAAGSPAAAPPSESDSDAAPGRLRLAVPPWDRKALAYQRLQPGPQDYAPTMATASSRISFNVRFAPDRHMPGYGSYVR